jgi:hypothetical protein
MPFNGLGSTNEVLYLLAALLAATIILEHLDLIADVGEAHERAANQDPTLVQCSR